MRIEYSAPTYAEPEVTEYRYRLVDDEPNWSAWTRETHKEYTNLWEGRYEFEVQARDTYDRLSEVASFRFAVLAPWYRSTLAILCYIAAGVAGIFAIVHLNSRRLIRRTRHLEELVAARTRELREASLNDPLTGLRNRRFISEVLEPEIDAVLDTWELPPGGERRAQPRTAQLVFGIVMFDLDHFKLVNDTYGHRAGDRVLIRLAETLRASVRKGDAVIRVGGEEFLVILKWSEPDYVARFAHEVKDRIGRTDFSVSELSSTTIRRTCSIGYTAFPFFAGQPSLISFEQVIALADLGLYHAKRAGRNLAVRLAPGPRAPSPEDVRKMVSSLEYAQEAGFVAVSTESPGASDRHPGGGATV